MTNNGFTPTQQRMIEILKDGKPHRREELHACLPDELGSIRNLQPHLNEIRKVLRPKGLDVICQLLNKALHYRLVRLVSSD